MSSSNSKKKNNFPEKDPYEVLGLKLGASETDISKAYRQLARNLHPDKLVAQNLSPIEIEKANIRFHDIQIARSFLLDHEHADDKRKYDAKCASDQLRKATEEARLRTMSDKRKRMREQLQKAEQQQEERQRRRGSGGDRRSEYSNATGGRNKKEELARQGRELREQYAAKVAQEKELALQNVQIRLKWSRKKLKSMGEESPSEDSIVKMLQKFGIVNHVQIIGNKGNLALVTFADESSCLKTVESFASSETWRATYVSKTKQQQQQQQQQQKEEAATTVQKSDRDLEDVTDWKMRHNEERERLLRQMEQQEANDEEEDARPFPPPFPSSYGSLMNSLERLERAEQDLLKDVLPPETLHRMKIGQS